MGGLVVAARRDFNSTMATRRRDDGHSNDSDPIRLSWTGRISSGRQHSAVINVAGVRCLGLGGSGSKRIHSFVRHDYTYSTAVVNVSVRGPWLPIGMVPIACMHCILAQWHRAKEEVSYVHIQDYI